MVFVRLYYSTIQSTDTQNALCVIIFDSLGIWENCVLCDSCRLLGWLAVCLVLWHISWGNSAFTTSAPVHKHTHTQNTNLLLSACPNTHEFTHMNTSWILRASRMHEHKGEWLRCMNHVLVLASPFKIATAAAAATVTECVILRIRVTALHADRGVFTLLPDFAGGVGSRLRL